MNSSSARIGYARVSTADQNLDAQIAALEAAGCTMVRTETGDGATLAGRPELGTILEFIQPGETLVVTRIDPLTLLCSVEWVIERLVRSESGGAGGARSARARFCRRPRRSGRLLAGARCLSGTPGIAG